MIEFMSEQVPPGSWPKKIEEAEKAGYVLAGDSNLLKSALRRDQLVRLEQNIRSLEAKRAEFNQRIEKYLCQLRQLCGALKDQLQKEEAEPQEGEEVLVKCLGCGSQRVFSSWRLLGRLPDPDRQWQYKYWIATPEGLQQGSFRCSECGGAAIRVEGRETEGGGPGG